MPVSILSLFEYHSIFPLIFILDQNYLMNSISVFDEKKNRAVELIIREDNFIESAYFYRTFPGATGLLFKDATSNKLFR